MTLLTHGDLKYQTSQQLSDAAEWPGLRVEHRQLKSGPQNALTPACTEVVLVLSGRANISRTGNGQAQDIPARPGTGWILPVGTEESKFELNGSMECLHLYMPPALIERSALADCNIDLPKAELAYAGGFADPILFQIGSAFRSLLGRNMLPTDRLFVDGMRTALAAHLLGKYSVDRWHPPTKASSLDPKRLKRVLDFIESSLTADISLDDLAAEACLSPFHFSRLFRDATGLTPHRYITDRRIQIAQDKLALNHSSLVEIALDTGFRSQANFIRVFRKATGLTPGQYRELYRR